MDIDRITQLFLEALLGYSENNEVGFLIDQEEENGLKKFLIHDTNSRFIMVLYFREIKAGHAEFAFYNSDNLETFNASDLSWTKYDPGRIVLEDIIEEACDGTTSRTIN